MKIINLVIENIKKIVAVEINPDGNVVIISGRNGQGKTSILDGIFWGLAGMKDVQGVPIREGQKSARVRLDMGEIIVTRNFRKVKDGDFTSSITVEGADGAKFGSPQKMLDGFLGALSFDPLEFARSSPKEQCDIATKLIDFDQAKHDRLQDADYSKRTDFNRQAKEQRVLADKIEVVGDVPVSLVNEDNFVDQIEQAASHNADIEQRSFNRSNMRAKSLECRVRAEELEKGADELIKEAEALDNKLAGAGALPAAIDVSEVRQRLETAKRDNEIWHLVNDKRSRNEQAEAFENAARTLTNDMEKREDDKCKAVEASKFPIPELKWSKDQIWYNSIPFDQASDSEKLRVSFTLAAALNPKINIVLVRGGSLLDSASLKDIAKVAKERDCQVIIERVDETGKVGFVIEDGRVLSEQEMKARG